MIIFDKKGGGERVALALARTFKADLYTGFAQNTYDMKGVKVKLLGAKDNNPLMRGKNIWKKFEGLEINYDLYIFSGTWCISAAKRLKPNILYMHTPPRFMYDLKEHFEGRMNPIQRIFFRRFCEKQKINNQLMTRQFDAIAANSENTRNRVLKYYGKDVYDKCTIINPPVDTKKFCSKKSENFYLSASRLDELKRIDIIIQAFIQNGKELVIASTGPDEKSLNRLADGYENIRFAGRLNEKQLIDMYARCKATIAAARDEDFGLVAVESMAAGKPCLAVREGGFLETVKDGKTGMFFHPDPESLNAAIEKFEGTRWNKRAIMKEAEKYDIKAFEKKMKELAKSVMH